MKTSVIALLRYQANWENVSDEAGYRNRRSMDRARGVGGEKQHDLGERLRRHPAARIGTGHVGAVLWRVDDAGQNTIDVDSLVAQFRRHAFGEAGDRALRRAV